MSKRVGIELNSYIVLDIDDIDFVDDAYNELGHEDKLALTREQFEKLCDELKWSLRPTVYTKLEQRATTSLHWEE